VVCAAALVATACGGGGGGDREGIATPTAPGGIRTVEVAMTEFRFTPDHVTVAAGETVRLVFRNEGTVVHDAFLGDEMAQEDHEREMREGAGHGPGTMGAGPGAITVEPGRTGTITHTFSAGERLLVGCHQPGHWAAGMKLAVTVRG
jgi:uncharacterized cupredoxin-like copper-binding protein